MTSTADASAGQRWLDATRARVDPAMRAAIERLDDANRLVAAYHLGFADAGGAPADRPRGKGVRAALALLAARAAGAGVATGVPAAVACELVHESSLLHDDIIDRDEVRRGVPTAWTVFGVAPALLAGDAVLTLAVEVLADSGTSAQPGAVAAAVRELATATRLVIAGQSADMAFESRMSVGLDEARAMVADKTAALLACAASLGAVLADAPETLRAGLYDFGLHLGMAFQLIDDILGIWGVTDRTGKPVRSDLASRKKSLPVVAAMASESLAGQRLAEIYQSDGELGDELLAAAAAAVEDAGGRDWATAEARRETRAAHEILQRLDIPEQVRADLVALTDLLLRRDR